MKKNTTNLGLWLSVLVTVIIFILRIPPYSKVILFAVFILGMLFLRRSVFYYVKANKKVSNEDLEAAWPLYRKAIRSGLQKQYVITAASMFLQRGDVSEGKAIIEQYLASSKGKNPNLDNISKVMVSMAYWMEKDIAKALDTVEKVYASGYRDKNLYINYSTYVLEIGNLTKAKALIDEAEQMGNTSPGIQDNRGWLHLLQGNWEKAEAIYSQLVGSKPHFPEPYVHYSQVLLHYGEAGKAISTLEDALQSRFLNTSGMQKSYIQTLLDLLKNPETRLKTAKEIDSDPVNVASGRMPNSLEGTFEAKDTDTLEGFAARPIKPVVKQKKVASDDNERMPNTDLTEADLEYIRKHNLSEN